MAHYIGNEPANGEFKHLDSIASQFNGSSVTFALQFNSVSQSVGDATQLIVSLNGVIQEPLTAYTLGTGGSYITFASAPASGDTCFIVMLGGVGNTTTPSDNSVTAAKIAAGAVTSSKISIDGDISFPDNNKAIFGDNNDLQIYHDGDNSYLFDAGTGTLNIQSNGSQINLQKADGTKMIEAINNGNVVLYSNGVERLRANGAGIDVTGTVTASGNITAGSSTAGAVTVGSANGFEMQKSGVNGYINQSDSGPIIIRMGSSYSEKIRIDSSGNVGIGTSNPGTVLHVYNSAQSRIAMENSTRRFDLMADGDGFTIRDQTAAVNRFRIDTSGNAIPTTDAAYDLGSTSFRWNNVYTTDLQLSNMGKEGGNDVDGTTGNWTLQEGAEDLFIINNNTGKKYRIPLEEVV